MSIFQLDLALEIAILIFISLFGVGLITICVILLTKCKRNKAPDLEVNRGQRVQEVSSIEIQVNTEISDCPETCNKNIPQSIPGGQKRSVTQKVKRSTSTYVHCPSPTYEMSYGVENPAYSDDDDFINVIYSL